MYKFFVSALIVAASTFGFAQAPTIVSGTIVDSGGNPATSGYVEFDIAPASSGVAYFVNGNQGIITPQIVTCGISSTGTLVNYVNGAAGTGVCNVWANNQINPANTTYTVQFAPGGTVTNSVSRILITGTTYNLNTPQFAPSVQITPQYTTLFAAPVTANIVPSAAHVFNLGSPLYPYANLYIDNLTCSGSGSCGVPVAIGTQGTVQTAGATAGQFAGSNIIIDSTGNDITIPGNLTAGLVHSKGPKYDVVAYGADPTGATDSTAAFLTTATAMASYIAANPGGGSPVMYVPLGHYNIGGSSTGYSAIIVLPFGSEVVGDGSATTQINTFGASNTPFLFNGGTASGNTSGQAHSGIFGITLHNASTSVLANAAGVECLNVSSFFMNDVVIDSFIGPGLSLQGSCERGIIYNVDITNSYTRAVVTEGDTNEFYFIRTNVMFPTAFSRQNPNGYFAGGTINPDYTPLVQLDGVNLHWLDSSIKGLYRACIRIASGEGIEVAHTYCENPSDPINLNPGIQVGGANELGHLTAAVTTTSLTFPVDDAIYQPLYFSDPALVTQVGIHSYVTYYKVFPLDAVYNDMTDLSAYQPSSGPPIYKGTVENIRMQAFSADGNGHLISRGTTAYAWPTNSIVEQDANSSYGAIRLSEIHSTGIVNPISGTKTVNGLTYTSNCSQTVPKTGTWTGFNMNICGEIFVGYIPDGYGVPFPSPTFYFGTGDTVDIVGPGLYFNSAGDGYTEQQAAVSGEGFIVVAADGNVNLFSGTIPNNDNPTNGYLTANPNNRVAYVSWPGNAVAQGQLNDFGTQTIEKPSVGYYKSVSYNNGFQNYVLGNECHNVMPNDGTSQSLSRTCQNASNWTYDTWNGSTWTSQFNISPSNTIGGALGSYIPYTNVSNKFSLNQSVAGVGVGQMQNILPNSNNFSASSWMLNGNITSITTGQADPWGGTTASAIAVATASFGQLTGYASSGYTLTPGVGYEVCFLAYANVSGTALNINSANGGSVTIPVGTSYPTTPQCANTIAGTSSTIVTDFGVDINGTSQVTLTLAAVWVVPAGIGVAYHPTTSVADSTPIPAIVVGSSILSQNSLTLTTTGSSGPATYVGGVLNIPIYSGSTGTISGPGTTTPGNAAVWNNTTGTLLGTGLPIATTGNNTIVETSGSGLIQAPSAGSFTGIQCDTSGGAPNACTSIQVQGVWGQYLGSNIPYTDLYQSLFTLTGGVFNGVTYPCLLDYSYYHLQSDLGGPTGYGLATLHLGNSRYCTTFGLVDTDTGAHIAIQGESPGGDPNGYGNYGGTIIQATADIPKTALNPTGAVIAHAAHITGASGSPDPYNFHLSNLMIDPNGHADQAAYLADYKEGYIDNVTYLEARPTSTLSTFQVGDLGNATALGLANMTGTAVTSINTLNVGYYATPGTYSLAFSGGCGGSGAAGTYTVSSSFIVASTSISAGGSYPCAPTVTFGTGAAQTAGGYQFHYNNLQGQSKGGGNVNNQAQVTMTLSGSTPIFSVNTPGSYYYATPVVQPVGLNYGFCSVIGYIKPTMSGTGPYTLVSLTAYGFTCAGTVPTNYNIAVMDMPQAQYGFQEISMTDHTASKVVINNLGATAAAYWGDGSNSIYGEHYYNEAVGFIDIGNNTHVAPEFDSLQQYGAIVEGKGSIVGAIYTTAVTVQPAFSLVDAEASGLPKILGNSCPSGLGSVLPGFSLQAWTTGGIGTQVSHPNSFGVIPYKAAVVGGLECDNLQAVNYFDTQTSFANSVFGTGWFISSSGVATVSGLITSPNISNATSGNPLYTTSWNNVSKVFDGTGSESVTYGCAQNVVGAGTSSFTTQFKCNVPSYTGLALGTNLGWDFAQPVQANSFFTGGNAQLNQGGFMTLATAGSTLTAATTIAPGNTTQFIYISGSASIEYITPPSSCLLTTQICVESFEAVTGSTWSFISGGSGSTSGAIAVGFTPPVNQPFSGYWDANTGLWSFPGVQPANITGFITGSAVASGSGTLASPYVLSQGVGTQYSPAYFSATNTVGGITPCSGLEALSTSGAPTCDTLSGTGTVIPTTVSPTFTSPTLGAASASSLVLTGGGSVQNGTSSNAQFNPGSSGPLITTSVAGNWTQITNSNASPTLINTWGSGTSSTRKAQIDANGIIGVSVGSTVAAATSITPTGGIFHVGTNTTAIQTITVGQYTSSIGGCITIIPDTLWTLTTSGGNIGNNYSATVNVPAITCYDGSKWYTR